MSLEPHTKSSDVAGDGDALEHYAGERYRHPPGSEKQAVGGAMAWLAFYAIALLIVVFTNSQKVADFVVAGAN